MIPFPLHLESLLSKPLMYLIFLVIGFLFGYVLEISGFNHSPSLAAQFYFKDLRVFKVFFTAIVVGMLLLFASSAVGLLDYNLIWVNPTYLWSGIVGGLIMGVGFILGGFCPALPWWPWQHSRSMVFSLCWAAWSAFSPLVKRLTFINISSMAATTVG